MNTTTLQKISALLFAFTLAIWTTPNPHVQSIGDQAKAIDTYGEPQGQNMSRIPPEAKLDSEELTAYANDTEEDGGDDD